MAKIVVRSLLALLVLYLLGRLLLGQNGLLHQMQIQKQNEELSSDIDSLEIILQKKKKEHDRLLHDTLYIEEIARTRFGMSRPGEVVFQFLPPQDSLMKERTQPPTVPTASK